VFVIGVALLFFRVVVPIVVVVLFVVVFVVVFVDVFCWSFSDFESQCMVVPGSTS